jgi:hypothetical protein
MNYCSTKDYERSSCGPLGHSFLVQRLSVKGKGKGKVYPRTGHEAPEREQRYSYTLSLP